MWGVRGRLGRLGVVPTTGTSARGPQSAQRRTLAPIATLLKILQIRRHENSDVATQIVSAAVDFTPQITHMHGQSDAVGEPRRQLQVAVTAGHGLAANVHAATDDMDSSPGCV